VTKNSAAAVSRMALWRRTMAAESPWRRHAASRDAQRGKPEALEFGMANIAGIIDSAKRAVLADEVEQSWR